MADNTYRAYVTDRGKAKIAAALAEGTQVQITHMVVGNGTTETPSSAITELLGAEVWRGEVNSVAAKADDPNIIVVEAMVPGTVGGFWLREFACLDQDGDMIAWTLMPESYKSVPSDGAVKSFALIMHIAVADAAAIYLEVGDDAVSASKQDIIDLREALGQHDLNPYAHPVMDCGYFEDEDDAALAAHNNSPTAHSGMLVDGNAIESASTATNLEEHEKDQTAHQNMVVDGNQ